MESKCVEAQGVRMRWEESGGGHPWFRSRYPHLTAAVVTCDAQGGGPRAAWEMVGYGVSIREGWDRNMFIYFPNATPP